MLDQRCLLILDKYSGVNSFIVDDDKFSGMPTLYYFIQRASLKYKNIDIIYPNRDRKGKKISRGNITINFISENRLQQFVDVPRTINKLIKKNDYYFVYITGYMNVPAMIVKEKFITNNIKIVSRFYGTFLYGFLKNKGLKISRNYFKNIYELLSLKMNNDLLVMTDDGTLGDKVLDALRIKNYLFLRNGISKEDIEKVTTINKKETRDYLDLPQDALLITNVSQLSRWKRVDIVIDAFDSLFKLSNKKIYLFIIGMGPLEKELKEYASQKKSYKNIVFVGFVDHDTVLKYMRASDLLTSFYDVSNVGNVLLEALSMGKCVIARATGDTKAIINNENGILIESENIENIALKINSLLEDKNRLTKIKRNALEFSQSEILDWQDRIDLELKAIEQL